MIKFENIDVYGWEAAIRGMRNPLNSWQRSDTSFYSYPEEGIQHKIGPNDYDLMMRLAKAGPEHRKYLRMINVTVDITAPLYWWKEFDTYKVGTVANSCSTMHKITDKEFTDSDFSCDHLLVKPTLWGTIAELNFWRELYLEDDETRKERLNKRFFNHKFGPDPDKITKKDCWWQMIQLLPSSYNQKRTVQMTYETLSAIRYQRKNHKLDEWSVGFMEFIENLPYSELITLEEECR